MNLNIVDRVVKFHCQLQNDKHHRYLSWEHCYSYFIQKEIDIEIDKACLHLFVYLASWGMYRGSSFLLWKDYLIHREVVKYLITKKHLQGTDLKKINDEYINEIIQVCEWIKKWYLDNSGNINGENKKFGVTDTLVTKIVLGTLGCTPAYDRYFVEGLKEEKINLLKPSFDGIKELVLFYKRNLNEFNSACSKIDSNYKIIYPPMKILDMYFWQIGFDKNKTS